MSKLTIAICVLGAAFFNLHLAQAIEADEARYKCHVQINEKHEEIHWFVLKKATPTQVKNLVKTMRVFASDGATQHAVSAVFECVEEGKRFAQLRARKLESQTVF